MQKICFIDMDGVLCDFVGAACQLFGKSEDFAANWPAGEYGMGKVLGCTEPQFWRKIEEHPEFWEGMKPYPWCGELIELAKRNGYAPYIATSPSLDPNSAKGKTEWIQKHIGRHFRDYFIGGKKGVLAAPGRVLIDDSDDQIAAFEKAGGYGVLFPRRWNANHQLSHDPMDYTTITTLLWPDVSAR